MSRIIYSTPIDRTRDVLYYLFHPYRQDPWCVVFFISPLSTGPVMCRFLYSTPIDKTRDVSFSLFLPYRQDPVMSRIFYSTFLFHLYRQDLWCVVLFIPPLSTGPVMCRIIYSTPIDRTRDLHGQHVAIRTKPERDGCVVAVIFTSLLMSYESLWQEFNGSVELQYAH